MNRIAIVGTSCSGKSTLARELSLKLQVPHIELDQLYWTPGWLERPEKEFLSLVEHAISEPDWVVDGNYAHARELIWPAANNIVWLDYSFPRVLMNAIRRSFYRAIAKEQVCGGNTETFRQSFFSTASVVLWVIASHKRNRVLYRPLLAEARATGKEIVVITSPTLLEEYLGKLGARFGGN